MISKTSRYRIVDLVAAGGMGVVYRAEDVALNRTVALKFLPPETATDEEYRARFLREARVAAALNHPNTCTVAGPPPRPDTPAHPGPSTESVRIVGGVWLRVV
jgi:serine/threonine protein kinase